MRTLDKVGLVAALAPHVSPPFGVHFLSPLGFVLVKVPGFITPNGFGDRNAVLQPVFERLLIENCQRFPSVRCRFGAALAGIEEGADGVSVGLVADGARHDISARFVLDCDGARTPVRTALGIPFDGSRIDEPHLVLDLADFPDQAPHSRFFCNPRRPVNSIPAPYGGRRMEFMLKPGEDGEGIVTDSAIRDLVDRNTPYAGVRLHIIRRPVYGFSERVARRLRLGRVFLLGDAAHVMPPFGGQGMNTGARDAANLCWKLAAVLRGQAQAQILDSYETERRAHIAAIVRYSVRVGRLANTRSRPLGLLRDACFALANLLPGVRRYFREMRHLPRPFLQDGLLVQDGDDGITGRILPRLSLLGNESGPLTLDDAAGPGFALVGVGVGTEALTAAAAHPLWDRLQPRLAPLASLVGDGAPGNPAFRFADGHGRARMARYTGRILMLRPDRYVAGAAAPDRFASLSTRLQQKFGAPGTHLS